MADKIETIDGSLIQHGPHNDRIYLMHLHVKGHASLIATLDRLAVEHGYGKIFARIPNTVWHRFRAAGYVQEAIVPGLFNGETDGLFIAKFFSQDRQQPTRQTGGDSGKNITADTAQTATSLPAIAACTPADAVAMAKIYGRTFETYAFPIHRPEYIRQMMAKDTIYLCARINKEIAALAAAEIDPVNQACEMTDFVTRRQYRRMGLANRLLNLLCEEALNQGVKTAYTIARADSIGMNRAFEKAGYHYAGKLVNNTQIGGRIRSMNVWYKRLLRVTGSIGCS
jgi:putative beta-lysine N-acetyltransferase